MAKSKFIRLTRKLKQIRNAKLLNWKQKAYYFRNTDLRPSLNTPLADPIIIAGIYRSGTTLLTSLIESIGVDLGPDDHKLQGIGKLGHLNPNGFQENFLMNDLGRYLLYYAGGSGIEFPDTSKVANLDLSCLNDFDFIYYSAVTLRDDRISDKIRNHTFKHYSISNLNQYFYDHFDTSCWGFKEVHSGIYMSAYHKIWKNAKWLCIYREPSCFVQSAKNLSKDISLKNWIEYYRRVITSEHYLTIHWVSYEDLLNKNEDVLRALISFVGTNSNDKTIISNLLKIINPSMTHYRESKVVNCKSSSDLYNELRKKSADCTLSNTH